MSGFVWDAVAVGAKEGLKLALVWLLLSAFLAHREGDPPRRRPAMRGFALGIAATSLLVVVSFVVPGWTEQRVVLTRLTGTAFFLCFLGGLAALLAPTRVPTWSKRPRVLAGVVFGLTAVYFAPDILSSSMYLRELSLMAESVPAVYGPAALAFALPVGLLVGLLRGSAAPLGRFFGVGQLLLVLALIKLLMGGQKGFGELSLLPALQEGMSKTLHDLVHQTFLVIQVPDHPLLQTTAWDFIASLFGPTVTAVLSLAVLLVPPLVYVRHAVTAPVPLLPDEVAGPESRKRRAAVQAERRRRTVPVLGFVLVVGLGWFFGAGGPTAELILPEPRPATVEAGVVTIPVRAPGADLRDGHLHKFVVDVDGQPVRLLAIQRHDGHLAVTLDACEICQPEGYGRQGDELMCLYCQTPIPLESIGRPGGCNPIPLEAEVTDDRVAIPLDEIRARWATVPKAEGL